MAKLHLKEVEKGVYTLRETSTQPRVNVKAEKKLK
jgi:hypothetical protein